MAGVRIVRLLVVEDDPGYQYLVQRALTDRGKEARWELTIAKDGEEALHVLFEEECESTCLPDLILLAVYCKKFVSESVKFFSRSSEAEKPRRSVHRAVSRRGPTTAEAETVGRHRWR